mgnify:CR=1 FL=1
MEEPTQLDLFPVPLGKPRRICFSAGRRVSASGKVRYDIPRGYAYQPGTGPKGETCATCAHFVRQYKFFKCSLCRPNWTNSPRTDIRAKSPACSAWRPAVPADVTDRGP